MAGAGRESFLLLVLLLDALGAGLVTPVLPDLVARLDRGSIPPAAAIGLLNAAYATSLFLVSPVLGRLSDRFGRRPFILLGLAGTVAHYVAAALAGSVAILLVARLFGGACGANAGAANAYMIDIVPAERRAAMFGRMSAAFGAGLALGPALGGLLGGSDPRLPFWAAAALAAAAAAVGARLLPEAPLSRAAGAGQPAAPARKGQSAAARFLLAGIFFYIAGQTALQTVWVLFLGERLGWRPADIGLSLTMFGLLWGVAQLALTPLATRRLGERRALLLGLATTIAAYLLYGRVDRGWQVYAVMLATAFAFVTGPAAQTLLARQGGAGQGRLQGLSASMVGLGSIAGPLLGGGFFGRAGGAFLVCAGLAGLSLTAALLSFASEGSFLLPLQPRTEDDHGL